MNLTGDHGLIDLMIGTRDRLVVDRRTDHLVDSGVMVAVLDPGDRQRG